MSNDTSWRIGSTESLPNRLYDHLRRGLNHDLVDYMGRRALDDKRACRVLEAGSGTAFASSLLADRPSVGWAAAVDHDLAALDEGRARDSRLPAAVADLRHLPFAADSFDLVWNSSTLEHLPDRADALREMARVTKSGGMVFVGVPYTSGPLGFQRWIADSAAGVWIGTVFDRPALEALMRSAGLQPTASLTYFFGFFVGVLAIKP